MTQLTQAPLQSRPLQGALLVAVAVLLFSCMDSLTKHMASAYPAVLVVAMRYLGNLVFLLLAFGPGQGRSLFRIQRKGLVLVRSLCLSAVSIFATLALQRMPVAETISIIFMAPFGTMILAGPILKEKVSALHWVAAAAGFAGVLLIVRPGSGLDPLGVVFALVAASGSIVYNMLSRALARTETTLSLMFYAALFGTLAFGAALPFIGPIPMPGALDMGLFTLMGMLALAGHLMFTQAFRLAPASTLASTNYLQLVWSGILGWLIFGHMPDAIGLAGMALIALGGTMATLWPLITRAPAKLATAT